MINEYGRYLAVLGIIFVMLFALGPRFTGFFVAPSWWDSDFDHRLPLTVSEPGVSARQEMVSVPVNFLYGASAGSIRVVGLEGEIPSQVEAHGSPHDSATVEFLAQVDEGETKIYYIYYSTGDVPPAEYGSMQAGPATIQNGALTLTADATRPSVAISDSGRQASFHVVTLKEERIEDPPQIVTFESDSREDPDGAQLEIEAGSIEGKATLTDVETGIGDLASVEVSTYTGLPLVKVDVSAQVPEGVQYKVHHELDGYSLVGNGVQGQDVLLDNFATYYLVPEGMEAVAEAMLANPLGLYVGPEETVPEGLDVHPQLLYLPGGDGGPQILATADESNLTAFNNSATTFTITFAGSGWDMTAGINMPKLATILSARLNLTGLATADTFNESIYTMINGTQRGDAVDNVANADFNGDGYADLLVGAPLFFSDGTNISKVYVIFGSSPLPPSNLINQTAGLEINATDLGYTGSSWAVGDILVDGGDLNNDGYDDIVVTEAFVNASDVNRAGKAYLFYGESSPAASLSVNGSANTTIEGTSTDGYLGGGAVIGDLNNDGYADLVLAEMGMDMMSPGDPAPTHTGRIFFMYGRDTVIASGNITDIANSTINASMVSDQLGQTMAIGDFNNDDYGDLAIAKPSNVNDNENNTAQVYVLYGGPGIIGGGNISSIANVTFNLTANLNGTAIGTSMATGDFNNDGYADLAAAGGKSMGAPGTGLGLCYVWYGQASPWTSGYMNDTANATLNTSTSNFGSSMDADDMNLDGYVDLVIGDTTAGGGGGYAPGRGYVLYGGPGGMPTGNVSLLANHTLNGTSQSGMGSGVSLMDFTANGVLELFIAAETGASPTDGSQHIGAVYSFVSEVAQSVRNVTLDISNDGSQEWNITGNFSVSQNVSNISSAITTYLASCSAVNSNCTVPINISVASAGRIRLEGLEVRYTTTSVDTTAPHLEVQSPTNNTNYTSINLAYTVTDETGLDKCWFDIDGQQNHTAIASCTNYTFNLAGGNHSLADGTHFLRIYANDTSNNTNSSTNFTFVIETIPPHVEIQVPVAGSTYTTTTPDLNFTVSDASREVDSCWYSNSSWAVNTTIDNCANTTLDALQAGWVNLWLASNDTLGNINATVNVSFQISAADTTAPVLNVQSPVNNTNYTTTNISVIYTAYDETALDKCWYTLDGTETTLSACANTTVLIAGGNHTLTISANDTTNNINTSSTLFLTIIPPNITAFNYSRGYADVLFPSAGEEYLKFGITLPKNSNVTSASFNVTGHIRYIYGGAPADRMTINATTVENAQQVGGSLASGDLNADGYQDLIIGSKGNDTVQGRVFVMYGPVDFSADYNLSAPNVTLNGSTDMSYRFFGGKVASADLNNDSYDDVIVAAEGDGGNDGQAYIFYGPPNSGNWTDANVTFNASDTSSALGSGLAVGDVNADSLKDLILGAKYRNLYGVAAVGQVYVLYGSNNGILGGNITEVANVTLNGTAAAQEFGRTVQYLGDLNADGFGDIAVVSGTGHANLFYGPPIGANSSEANGTLNGSFGGTNQIGSAVDLNADGYDDIVLAIPPPSGPTADEGYVQVLYGGADVMCDPYCIVNATNATFYGLPKADQFAYAMCAGSFDGDIYDDIITSSYNKSSAGGVSEGALYHRYSNVWGATPDNVSESIASEMIVGEKNYEQLGTSLLLVDLDNSGTNELVAGMAYAYGDSRGGIRIFNTTASYPVNISVDVAIDGTNDLNLADEFSTTANVSGLATVINAYLASCTAVNGNCTVPILVNSSGEGRLRMDDLKVFYSYLDRSSETVPPALVLSAPVNNTNYTNFTLTYTAQDETALDKCWFDLSGTLNRTAIASCGNVSLSVSDGTHYLVVYANDTSNNTNSSANISFTVDGTPPVVNIQIPSGSGNYSDSAPDLNFTAFDASLGLDTCWYTNSSWNVNTTLASCANITLPAFPDGGYTLYLAANDSLGNLNITASVAFTVDTVAPVLTVLNPGNGSQYNSTSIELNYTASDATAGLDRCWYNLNGAETGLANCDNATISGSTGSNWLIVYANDTAGNQNSSANITFTVEAVGLSASLTLPGVSTNARQNETFVVNASVTCAAGNCGQINGTLMYNLTGVPNETVSSTAGATPFFTTSSSPRICSASLSAGSSCTVQWTVNASGTIGTDWLLNVNFSSSDSGTSPTNTSTFQVNVSAVPTLSVSITRPTVSPYTATLNELFTVNATISCSGAQGLSCEQANATVRYDGTDLNTTTDTPFFTTTGQPQTCSASAGSSCTVQWSVNASGGLGNTYAFNVFTLSNDTLIANTTSSNTSVKVSSVTTLTTSTFSDGSSSKEIEFEVNGTAPLVYVKVARGANVTTATVALTGVLTLNATFSNHTVSGASSSRLGSLVHCANVEIENNETDLLVAASTLNHVYLYYSGLYDATSENMTLYNISVNDSPSSLAVGLVNNDSYPDIVFGSEATNRVYVFFGPADNSTPNITFSGDVSTGKFGSAVAIGDVNDDDFNDVIVGSEGNSSVFIYFGRNQGPDNSSANITLEGVLDDDFGASLAVGNIDEDSYDDIAVGAPSADISGTDEGRIKVFYGSSAGPGTAANATVNGLAPSDKFGTSLAFGNFNNDTYNDLAVGSEEANAVRILYGRSMGINATGQTISGDSGSMFGFALAAGDFNNDTYDDLVIGEYKATVGGSNQVGQLSLYKSTGNGLSASVYKTIPGQAALDQLGYSVCIGDFDSDGMEEIVAGSLRSDSYAGKASLYDPVTIYPLNPALDVGNDGDNQWSYTGALEGSNTTSDFAAELNSFLPACTCSGCTVTDSDKNCSIPLNLTAQNEGTLTLSGLDVRYEAVASLTLNSPTESAIKLTQNHTLTVQATATCNYVEHCGNVTLYLRYNQSSPGPNQTVNTSFDAPYYAASGSQPYTCVLDQGDYCTKTWTVNATGAIGTLWYFDVYANSTNPVFHQLDTGDFGIDISGNLIRHFNGSHSSVQITLTNSSGGTEMVYFEVPRRANFTDATLNLTGAGYYNGTAAATELTLSGAYGKSLAVGDVNNDGYQDLLVGAPDENRAHLTFGSSSGISNSTTKNVFTKSGSFGEAVALGDLNGDGYDDVIVMAPGANRVYVYDGATSINYTYPSTTITTDTLTSGRSLAVGDVDNDGYQDLLVGAPKASTEGKAFLYRGRAIGIATTPTYTFLGESTDDNFGDSVAIGDMDDNGYDDVFVGAYLADAPSVDSGRVYVYNSSGTIENDTANRMLNGSSAGDSFGSSIAIASNGNLNNDTYADLVVGAKDAVTGKVYVFYGGSAGVGTTANKTLSGESNNDYFGTALSFHPDLNNDGLNDLIVGAPYNDDGGNNAGKIYIYYGNRSGLNSLSLNYTGSNVAGYKGHSVAQGNDDDLGLTEFFVGEYGTDRVHRYEPTKIFPRNPTMDVGNDGDYQWSLLGTFTYTANTTNFAEELTSFLPACTCTNCTVSASGYNCTIPATVSFSSKGYLTLSDPLLEYAETNPRLSTTLNMDTNSSLILVNETFTVNATVRCDGGNCYRVNVSVRYNVSSSNANTLVNATNAFRNVSGGPAQCTLDDNQTCSVQWTINATKVGNWRLDAYSTSDLPYIPTDDTSDFQVNVSARPTLLIDLLAPALGSSTNKIQNETILVNATITCAGTPGLSCWQVNSTLRYWKEKNNSIIWNNFTVFNGMAGNDVRSFALGADLWIGTTAGLSRYNKSTGNWTNHTSFPSNNTNALLLDGGLLWVGTNASLTRYNLSSGNWTNYTMSSELSNDTVTALAGDGQLVWAGTSHGLSKYNKSTGTFTNLTTANGLANNSVTAVANDTGVIWVGTADGVSRYNLTSGSFTNYTVGSGLLASATSLALDGQYLWIGTASGISRLNTTTGNFTNYTTSDGLAANRVNGLALDGDTLWVGTADGVSRYNKSSGNWTTISGGLPAAATHSLMPDGEITWFGTTAGLSRYNLTADSIGYITVSATTTAFNTTDTNPTRCTLTAGTNCSVQWIVNTSTMGSWQFDIFSSSNDTRISSNHDSDFTINVTSSPTLSGTVQIPDPGSSSSIAQNNTFVYNLSISCSGAQGLTCDLVNATLRANQTRINSTLDTPFDASPNPTNCTLAAGGSCTVQWTVNATGTVGTSWLLDVLLASNNTFVQHINTSSVGYNITQVSLLPSMNRPASSSLTYVIQNDTLTVNASVTCQAPTDLSCSEVNATLRYNLTNVTSTTPILTEGSNPVSCGALTKDETCTAQWTVNITGNISVRWPLDILFTSNDSFVPQADTADFNVEAAAVPTIASTITLPTLASKSVIQNETFLANVTTTCSGAQGLTCAWTNTTLRYNSTAVNTTGTPFVTPINPYNCSLSTGESCSLQWTVNATGPINTSWTFDALVRSNDTRVSSSNSTTFQINISSEPLLVVNITRPSGDDSVIKGESFLVNASVTCRGDQGLTCSQVRGYLRHNQFLVSGIAGDTPFYILDSNPQACALNTGSSCDNTWTVYATGQVSTSWLFDVKFDSSHHRVDETDTGDVSMTIAAVPSLSLNYSLSLPASGTVLQNGSFSANATVTCTGYSGLDCGMVNATLSTNGTRLNSTSALAIHDYANPQNTTISTGSAQTFSWQINASGAIGTDTLLQVDILSSDSRLQGLTGTHPVNISGYPVLAITIQPASAQTVEVGSTITVNATVLCVGMPDLNCSNVNITLLYDSAPVSTHNSLVNTSDNVTVGWLASASGSAGSTHSLMVFANSSDPSVGNASTSQIQISIGSAPSTDVVGAGSVYSPVSAPKPAAVEEEKPKEVPEAEELPETVVTPLLKAAIPELLDLKELVMSKDVDISAEETRGETPRISREVAERTLQAATSEAAKIAIANIKEMVIAPTQASVRRVVDSYRIVNKITKRTVNESIITLKVYAVADMEDVLIVESLPDSQVDASEAYFFDPQPIVLQDRFIVAWKVDSMKAGEMRLFKYALAGGMNDVGSDVIVSAGAKLVTAVEDILHEETKGAIGQAEHFITSLGKEYEISDALERLAMAKAAFNEGDYLNAKKYAEEAKLLVEPKEVAAAKPGFRLVYIVLPLLMVLLVVGYVERYRIKQMIAPTPLLSVPEPPERPSPAAELESHIAATVWYGEEAVAREEAFTKALDSMRGELRDMAEAMHHQIELEKLKGKPVIKRGTKLSAMVLSSQLAHTLDEAEGAIAAGRYDELDAIYKRATGLFNEISAAKPELRERMLEELKRIDTILTIILEIGNAHESLETGELADAKARYKQVASLYNRLIQRPKGNEGDLNEQIVALYQKILEYSQT